MISLDEANFESTVSITLPDYRQNVVILRDVTTDDQEDPLDYEVNTA
jgi:hypothetical protein